MALFFDIWSNQFYKSGIVIIELHLSMCLLVWIHNSYLRVYLFLIMNETCLVFIVETGQALTILFLYY